MITYKNQAKDFNPRSHKGSDALRQITHIILMHFNPRSHKGSDRVNPPFADCLIISIHAPTRGATEWYSLAHVLLLISIHAPTRGATVRVHHKAVPHNISIHAPTRGATRKGNKIIFTHALFQSTLPQGERLFLRAFDIKLPDFNPRSHKGSDQFLIDMVN